MGRKANASRRGQAQSVASIVLEERRSQIDRCSLSRRKKCSAHRLTVCSRRGDQETLLPLPVNVQKLKRGGIAICNGDTPRTRLSTGRECIPVRVTGVSMEDHYGEAVQSDWGCSAKTISEAKRGRRTVDQLARGDPLRAYCTDSVDLPPMMSSPRRRLIRVLRKAR